MACRSVQNKNTFITLLLLVEYTTHHFIYGAHTHKTQTFSDEGRNFSFPTGKFQASGFCTFCVMILKQIFVSICGRFYF